MTSPVILPDSHPNLPAALRAGERADLLHVLGHYHAVRKEWLRRMIVDYDRIDLLASIFGIKLQPFHIAIARNQLLNPHNLVLVFRGAGKSVTGTTLKCIHYIVKGIPEAGIAPGDVRILLASKTAENSWGFLKEIKEYLEHPAFIEVFGAHRGEDVWSNSAIEVKTRRRKAKEPTVNTVGVDGATASRHYDVIIADDLVDEKNSSTKGQRDKLKTWYYKLLHPTLEPHSHFHHIGTRYHYDDLYGHLQEEQADGTGGELKAHTLIIRALDSHDRSPWPAKYSAEWLRQKRKQLGMIIFNSQYQCDVEAMKGEIFDYDWMGRVRAEDIPKDLRIFTGVDLAIRESEQNDRFAITTIGVHGTDARNLTTYVLSHWQGQLSFSRQTEKIIAEYNRWNPIRVGVETNAYQYAQYQRLKERVATMRVVPLLTVKDKLTRAHMLAAQFEAGAVYFAPGLDELIEQLVMFPSHPIKDGFDSLDLAVTTSHSRGRGPIRTSEPGVI